jgi:hypothetical protein
MKKRKKWAKWQQLHLFKDDAQNISAAGMQSESGSRFRHPIYENPQADVPPSPAGNEALIRKSEQAIIEKNFANTN